MPTTTVYDTKGKKVSAIRLPDKIFKAKINEPLMAQAVRVYLSNQRKAKAKVKTRGEVNLSGRKIYRQKGTGRARHGDRKAPIFVKGGKAHGPTGQQNYKLKMNKKMKRLALFSALTSKLKDKEIIIVDDLEKIKPKTKEMVKIIKNLKLKVKSDNSKFKITFVLPEVMENVIRAGRNIPGVKLSQARLLNTYEVLNGGKLIFMKKSINVLKETFLKHGSKSSN